MKYSPRQYARALHELVAEKHGHGQKETVKTFAHFLQKNNALHLSREIYDAFERHSREVLKTHEVVVKVADEKTAKKIKSKLGASMDATITIDPKLVGGTMITIDDIRIDNSIKGRLLALKRLGQ